VKSKPNLFATSYSTLNPSSNDKEKNSLSFEYLKSLDERVQRLSNMESEFMLSFWSDSLQCFQIYPNMTTSRVSITTTW
jgi:hypothetical protein